MKSNLLNYFFRLLKKGAFIKFLATFQIVSAAPADTTLRVLSVSEFMEIVKNYHPVAKQAQLILEQAKAKLLIARGGWDPDLYSNYKNKTYDGANYYSYFESKISPIWHNYLSNDYWLGIFHAAILSKATPCYSRYSYNSGSRSIAQCGWLPCIQLPGQQFP